MHPIHNPQPLKWTKTAEQMAVSIGGGRVVARRFGGVRVGVGGGSGRLVGGVRRWG